MSGTKKRVVPENSEQTDKKAAKKQKVEFEDQESDRQDQAPDNDESGTNIQADEEGMKCSILFPF